MIVEVGSPSGDGRVSLHIQGRGLIDGPGKIVATLLAAVESMTGVPVDEYTDQLIREHQRRTGGDELTEPDRVVVFSAHVDQADPDNDQLAAQVRDDLALHLGSTRKTLAQGSRVAAIAVIATALDEAGEEVMSRARLADLLAVAMVQLVEREAGT